MILTSMYSRPAIQQSGHGGTFVIPTVNITEPGGEFGSIPVGAPPFGHDDNDLNMCMFSVIPSVQRSSLTIAPIRVLQRNACCNGK